MRTILTRVATLSAVTLALLACACTPAGVNSDVKTGAPSVTATRTIAPGLSEWADGTAEAAGWVAWLDLEGGFWALRDGPAVAADANPPKVVAVLLPGSVGEATIAKLDGAFAVAGGRIQGGASIRMAGPEISVERIDPATPAGK